MESGILYLQLRPEMAKGKNLPVRLPICIEDAPLLHPDQAIPLDIVFRGLERQYQTHPDEYYRSYYLFFLFEMVKSNIREEKTDHAQTLMDRAKTIAPQDYRVPFYLGILARNQGLLGEAENHFRLSILSNPRFQYGYFELGQILIEKAEYDEAVEVIEHLLEIDPDFLPAYIKLGDLFFQRGDLKSAKLCYEKSSDFSSETFTPARIRLGVLYHTEQRFEEARKVLEEALERAPESLEGHYNLAFSLYRLGKPFKAIHHLRRAVEIAPQIFGPKNELFLIYKNLGLYDEAYDFEKIYGPDVEACFQINRIQMLALTGKHIEAKSLLDELDDSLGMLKVELRQRIERQQDAETRLGKAKPFDLVSYVSRGQIMNQVPAAHHHLLHAVAQGVIPHKELDQSASMIWLSILLPIFREFKDYPFDLERAWTQFAVGVTGSMEYLGLCRCLQSWMESIQFAQETTFDALHPMWVSNTMEICWSFSQRIYRWDKEDLQDSESLLELGEKPDTLEKWLMQVFNYWQAALDETELRRLSEIDPGIAKWVIFFNGVNHASIS